MNSEQPNLDYIKELAGGDSTFESKFLNIVKNEFPKEKQSYLDSLESQNFEKAAELVHKLKHKFNILGLQKGYRLAVGYEEELKCGGNKLRGDFLRVLNVVENFIVTI